MTTYTITPLKWEHSKNEFGESWTAYTIFSTLTVDRSKGEDNRWGSWRFHYCRDEYYDEDSVTVESAADGKKRAEAWYLETLLPALTEVTAEAAMRGGE